ncbi:MAG: CRISPR-associated protein Cas4 [Paludibacteraceae bacterium]|nr:CRISPR-associated protein Cas4 [Paludibacteraceae bacterium]
MSHDEEDFIAISGLQHFAYCKRQWGLIHLEKEWADNFLTSEGQVKHERVDSGYHEFRKGLRQFSGLYLKSQELGLYGRMDILEIEETNGPPICIPGTGLTGNWQLKPVEFKHGKPKQTDADLLQLCAQALCLEEMTGLPVTEGSIFYCQTRHRTEYVFTPEIREKTKALANECHILMNSKKLPSAEHDQRCFACSLKGICQPNVTRNRKLHQYYQKLFEVSDL